MKQTILAIFLSSMILTVGQSSYSEPSNSIQLVQRDIAELMMQKYHLEVVEQDFTIFYRLSVLESLGELSSEDHDSKVISMEINQERTSLIIKLDNIKQADMISIRFPQELISAEEGELTLLVDGKEKGYEWSVQEKSRNLIFVIPYRTTEVEIIGTRVIPEFTSALFVLTIITSVLVVQRVYRRSKINS